MFAGTRRNSLLGLTSLQRSSLELLLTRIYAPEGCESLSIVLQNIEALLVRIADETGNIEVRRFRDAARTGLNVLLHHPELSEDSHTRSRDFHADPVYRILVDYRNSINWESRTLADLLVLGCLIGNANERLVHLLARAINGQVSLGKKNHGAFLIPRIPTSPSSCRERFQIINRWFELRVDSSSDIANLAVFVGEITKVLLVGTAADSVPAIVRDTLELLQQDLNDERSGDTEKSPTERLRHLSVTASTRLGASIRDSHRPQIQTVPDYEQVAAFLYDAGRFGSRELAGWLTIHAALSRFGTLLLNGPPVPRLTQPVGGRFTGVTVSAPRLGKQSPHVGATFENISAEISLPVPKRMQRFAEANCAEPDGFSAMNILAREFARRWRRHQGLTIRIGALRTLLVNELSGDQAPDLTLARLLGLDQWSSRDAGIYYFSPSTKEVRRRYEDAVTAILHKTKQAEWLDEGWSDVCSTHEFFGASARPSLGTLQTLVRFLRERSRLPRGRPVLAKQIEVFNFAAAYVTVMYLLATGARPVENVFPTGIAWDSEVGEVLISEKDSLLYRSTRKLPVPNCLRAAFDEFDHQRQVLEVALGCRLSAEPLVFLVEGQHATVPPTIANLRKLVPGFGEHWPWPRDILRHHFRSRMWELGCDAATLDRLMGHLGKSHTPDVLHSMEPISRALAASPPYVKRLLDEAGF